MQASRHRTPRIALLLQGTRHYERALLSGIADYANLHGPWQFYRNVSYLPDEQADPKAMLRFWDPDAIIVRESSPHYFDKILKTNLPIVYCPTTEPHPDVTNVVVDDIEVGRMAARHLYENGIREFAYCGMSKLFFWSRLRGQGFREQVEAYGHQVRIFESTDGKEYLSWNKRFDVLKQWLAKLPPNTGLMACTDDFTLLVQEACIAVGRTIPDDISLIGVGNDTSVCKLAPVPISSIDMDIKRAGYEAAHYLATQLKGSSKKKRSKPSNIIIEPLHVVARRSTDPNETEDSEVAKAITFITGHLNQPIDVNDIVAQVNLSRRGLYDRFQAVTGKTISSYIRQRRLDHFSRLLLETNLTISEIAYSMGYESDTNVARLFKKQKGITPLAYRRKHAFQTKSLASKEST